MATIIYDEYSSFAGPGILAFHAFMHGIEQTCLTPFRKIRATGSAVKGRYSELIREIQYHYIMMSIYGPEYQDERDIGEDSEAGLSNT